MWRWHGVCAGGSLTLSDFLCLILSVALSLLTLCSAWCLTHHQMSENVDQLKQLIAGTLEHRGVLSKIRAELRHHVFLALDEQESAAHQAQTPNNTNGNSSHSTTTPKGGHIATKKKKIAELHGNPLAVDLLELVKDFCDCYELEYTNALLNTEAEGVSHACLALLLLMLGNTRHRVDDIKRHPKYQTHSYIIPLSLPFLRPFVFQTGHKVNRKLLADKYHLSPSSTLSNQPLLLELLQRHSGVSTVSDSSVSPREEVGIGSRRSLYREKSNHDDENDGRQEREREKEQRERQQERERQQAKERAVRQQQEAEQKSKQLSEAELSPRNPPPALAPLKKPSERNTHKHYYGRCICCRLLISLILCFIPCMCVCVSSSSLGSLAPLAPLGGAKPSLAPLSAPKGLSVQPSLNDKKSITRRNRTRRAHTITNMRYVVSHTRDACSLCPLSFCLGSPLFLPHRMPVPLVVAM